MKKHPVVDYWIFIRGWNPQMELNENLIFKLCR